MINTAGLLSVHRFVSHITGFAGHFAVAIYDHEYLMALYALSLPATFLFGSMYSGYFTEARRLRGHSPQYVLVMLTITLILLALGLAGTAGALGVFGEPFESLRDYILLVALSFACGAQNGLFTHYSGSVIRTTHLTGITTDLGIGLIREFFVKDVKEGKLNMVRLELICSFIIGSVVSVYIFMGLEFAAFFILAALALGITARLYWSSRKQTV
jgi:uncharacterized membrane protein YoaK (UPF0700 family)